MKYEDYVTRSQAQKLARDLAQLKREIKSVAAAPADLRHAAIDGAPLPVKDAEGNITAYIGGQEPGSALIQHTQGPAPEQPEPLFIDAGGEAVKVQHSGLDVHENPAPDNWHMGEVHAAQNQVFEPSLATFAGHITEPNGSFTHRLPAGEWWLAIVWVTLDDQKSVMSEPVLADVAPLVDTTDLENTLTAAEQIISDAMEEAQGQLDTLNQRLDDFEPYDPADLQNQLAQVAQNLADARDEAAQLVAGLEERVDGIKIPDVSNFITQTEVDAAAAAAEAAAIAHADLVAKAAEDAAITEAQAKADAAKEAAEAAAAEHAQLVAQGAQDAAIAEAEAKANAAKEAAEAAAKTYSDSLAASTLADAIADAQDKMEAAQAAAEQAAKEYTDQQDAETLAAAATDAQAKADAAQSAAETKAQQLAEAEAEAAQSAAISAAAQDALDKANAARDAAIASSAEDAETKSAAAQQAAEEYALAQAKAESAAAKAEAITEAATAAQAAADAAQQAAEATASADATAKADAAQAAAEAKAQQLAEAEAQAAQSAAEASAAADALAKANAAKDAAITAASEDAQAKADAAQQAAEVAAAADAKAKADAAQAEAIRQAELDATAKADAAQAAAEAAAQQYADKQDAVVKAEAAADAQDKADAVREVAEAAQAEAEAKASPEWVLSRGTDLVTNGTGYLGDNTNFSAFEYDPTDSLTGARGSFVVASDSRPSGRFTDELLPVDPSRSYLLSVMAREQNPEIEGDSTFYVGLSPFDTDGRSIPPQSYSHDALTMTELTAPLNPGDTTIEVASTANFGRLSSSGYAGIWDWVDSNGKTWPAGEYTRDYPRYESIDGNTIHLQAAYRGETRPVGTPVSNNRAGGTYMYAVSNKRATQDWERATGIFGGLHDTTNGAAVRNFPPATAAVKVMWLPNYRGASGSSQAFAAISFSDATAALAEAEQAKADAAKAQEKADKAERDAEAAHTAAGTAYDHADAALNRAEAVKGEAAADATTKANAAQQAAETKAQELAEAEAQAAQSAAEKTAAADALTKANAARDAAIASASTDADAKAEAARKAAEKAAATDAKAKADAAQAEAIRQASLDATAKANAAKAAAEAAAKQHADALPKMLGGTTAPTGTAPNGSIWFRRDSNNTVIGRWERIGNAWVQQEVSGQLIDNLEAGKITALHTEFAESVVGKLWVQLAVIDRLVATSAWIGGAMIGEDAVQAKHITASETLSGKVAEFLKLSVADLIASEADIDEAVVNQLWAAFGVFDRLTAGEAWVTGDLVVGETIRTRHLQVTEDMVGRFAEFLHLVVGRIDVNALWADTSWQAAGHFGSEDADQKTTVDGSGVTLYRKIDGEFIPAAQFGGGDLQLSFFDENQESTGAITQDGHVSGAESNFTQYNWQGRPLFGRALPEGNTPVLDSVTHGFIARNERYMLTTDGANQDEYGFLPLTFHAVAGMTYEIIVPGIRFWQTPTHPKYAKILYTTDGRPPVLSDEMLGKEATAAAPATGNQYIIDHFTRYFHCESDCEVNLLLTVRAPSGPDRWWQAAANGANHVEMYVRPAGITAPLVGGTRDVWLGHPDLGGGQKSFFSGWTPTWHQAYYRDNGGRYTGSSTRLLSGLDQRTGRYYATHFGGYRNSTAFAGGSGEPGLTMAQALSGAFITDGTLTLTGTTGGAAGGTVWVRWHTLTSAPTTLNSSLANNIQSVRVSAGQQSSIDLPRDVLDAIAAGTFQGFTLYHPNDQSPYVTLHSNASTSSRVRQPMMRLRYVK